MRRDFGRVLAIADGLYALRASAKRMIGDGCKGWNRTDRVRPIGQFTVNAAHGRRVTECSQVHGPVWDVIGDLVSGHVSTLAYVDTVSSPAAKNLLGRVA